MPPCRHASGGAGPRDAPSRRAFLALAAASGVALAGRRAGAIGDASKFRIGHIKLGEQWNPRPSALERLAWEIQKRTAIPAALEPKPVELGDRRLHETPFLYLAGDREFALPPSREVERLRRFLSFGGFLLVDSAEGSTGGAFDRSVRKLVDATFPSRTDGLRLIPRDHVVYKSFYLVDNPVGRLAIGPGMEGILRDGRLVVAYVQNDLGGAWARDNFGNYRFQCEPGGERQREMAFRFGINAAMYALCLDYKADQVHVPFIMRRRRFRPDDGAVPAPEPLRDRRR